MCFSASSLAVAEAILSALSMAKRFAMLASEPPEAENSQLWLSSYSSIAVVRAALSDSPDAFSSATFTPSISRCTLSRPSPMPKKVLNFCHPPASLIWPVELAM